MFSKILKSKAFIAITAAVTTAAVVGGIAYAVTVVPPNPSDLYYACVSTAGVVKSSTIKLNVQPASCPAATDTVRSWNAQGPQGLQGDPGGVGAQGDPGPQGAAAPAQHVRVIHVSDAVTVSSGATLPFGGPIDVSNCESFIQVAVSATTTASAGSPVTVQIVGQSIMPGNVNPFYDLWNRGSMLVSAPNPRATYAPTSSVQAATVQLFAVGFNSPPSTVNDAWITCRTF